MSKYAIEEIKKAFWDTFHRMGELWFDYLGSEEENYGCTEGFWNDFVKNLKTDNFAE